MASFSGLNIHALPSAFEIVDLPGIFAWPAFGTQTLALACAR